MNRYRMRFAPHVWTPALNPTLVRLLRPLRMRRQARDVQVSNIEVVGAEIVSRHLQQGDGVMIMPNHSEHADPYVIYAAADQAATALYIMATWHVFHDKPRLVQWILRRHGCFSVDREANDIGAFRLATGILQQRREPLVIFPEGEIYHCNDRVTPFREGAAAIAVAAARKAERRIVCIPCAIQYRYEEDPTAQLEQAMGDLEQAIFWRRRDGLPLESRIYRFADALLAVKEMEYFDQPQAGRLPQRIRRLGDHILEQVELRRGLDAKQQSIPERIKQARRTIIAELEQPDGHEAETRRQLENDLEDLFVVVQSFSYPGDYVNEKPTIERMAETIDKFEEDVLRLTTASIKARRRARVQFGEAVEVSADRSLKGQTTLLTGTIEARVQAMLDGQFG